MLLSEPDLTDLGRLYRWGWAPLVAGCVAIVAMVILFTEVLFARWGYAEPDPARRVVFIGRATLTSFALAAWAGGYVLLVRRRIEAARRELAARRRGLEALAVRAEQEAGLGAFSRILAHEVRNPLNTIAVHCELLERQARRAACDTSTLETVQVLRAETARLEALVDDYVTYGRGGVVLAPTQEAHLDAIARAQGASVLADPALHAKGLTFDVNAPDDLPAVRADESKLADAVRRLFAFGAHTSRPGGALRVALRSAPPCVELEVRHAGAPFADPGAVFRPFFTTRDAGTGFALAIVRDIVRAHGGEVHARNVPTGEPAIVMRIPCA